MYIHVKDRKSNGDKVESIRPGHDIGGTKNRVDNVLGLAEIGLIFTRSREG